MPTFLWNSLNNVMRKIKHILHLCHSCIALLTPKPAAMGNTVLPGRSLPAEF